MQILLTNDDGIFAPGLAAMYKQLVKIGNVTVAAPANSQSGASHSITYKQPLVCNKVDVNGQFTGYSVQGSPADCVKLALMELLEEKVDLLVSGINNGANVGINVLYSGTVAAAAEGALLGFPAVAVSMERGIERDFDRAAEIALPVIRALLDEGLSAGQLININIPDLADGPPKGVRVVPQATRMMEDSFIRHAAPDGCNYYWLVGGDFRHAPGGAESDLDAIRTLIENPQDATNGDLAELYSKATGTNTQPSKCSSCNKKMFNELKQLLKDATT